jgi:hypothetical protein
LSQLKSLKSVGLQPNTLWLFWAQEEEKQIQEASQPAVVKVVGETSVVVLCPETGTFFRWDSSFLTHGFGDDVMQVPQDEAMASQWATQDLRGKSHFICGICNDSAMILVPKGLLKDIEGVEPEKSNRCQEQTYFNGSQFV